MGAIYVYKLQNAAYIKYNIGFLTLLEEYPINNRSTCYINNRCDIHFQTGWFIESNTIVTASGRSDEKII